MKTTKICTFTFTYQVALFSLLTTVGVVAPPPGPSPVILEVEGDSGSFLSPNHPQKYPSNQNLTYRAYLATPGPLILQVHFDIDLQKMGIICFDYVSIHGWRYCGYGTATRQIRINGSEFVMTFYSDLLIQKTGFNVSFSILEVLTVETTLPTIGTSTIELLETDSSSDKSTSESMTASTVAPNTAENTTVVTSHTGTFWTDTDASPDPNSEETTEPSSEPSNTSESSTEMPMSSKATEIVTHDQVSHDPFTAHNTTMDDDEEEFEETTTGPQQSTHGHTHTEGTADISTDGFTVADSTTTAVVESSGETTLKGEVAEASTEIFPQTTDEISTTAAETTSGATSVIDFVTSDVSQTTPDVSQTTSDKVSQATSDVSHTTSDKVSQTASEVSQTTSEVSQTTADVSQTTSDVSQTTADVSQTTSDVSQTTSDVSQTAADVSQTTSDVSQTTSDVSQTTSDVSQTTADVSQTATSNISQSTEAGTAVNENITSSTTEYVEGISVSAAGTNNTTTGHVSEQTTKNELSSQPNLDQFTEQISIHQNWTNFTLWGEPVSVSTPSQNTPAVTQQQHSTEEMASNQGFSEASTIIQHTGETTMPAGNTTYTTVQQLNTGQLVTLSSTHADLPSSQSTGQASVTEDETEDETAAYQTEETSAVQTVTVSTTHGMPNISTTVGSNVSDSGRFLSTLSPMNNTAEASTEAQTDVTLLYTGQSTTSDATVAGFNQSQLSASQRSCHCAFAKTMLTLANENREEMAKLITSLTLKKDNISATRRRYISVPDHRHSSQMIGAVGIIVCALPMLFMVIIDLLRLCAHVNTVLCGSPMHNRYVE